MNEIFDFRRFNALVYADLALHKKVILKSILMVMLVLAIVPFPTHNTFTFMCILFGSGLLVTSRAFHDLHNAYQTPLYVTLPCSNLEKFASKWFLTSVGFVIAVVCLYEFYLLLASLFNVFRFKLFFPILHLDLWETISDYLVIQSLYLLGAAFFKRHSLIKTTLAICGSFVFFSIFGFFLLSHAALMQALHHNGAYLWIQTSLKDINRFVWGLVAPVCWYLTYRVLTNYELN